MAQPLVALWRLAACGSSGLIGSPEAPEYVPIGLGAVEAPPPDPAAEGVPREADRLFSTRDPLVAVPDPLAGTEVESCALWQDTRCEDGRLQRCVAYDPMAASVAAPGGAWERALWYERWFDKFHSPDGQAVERQFDRPTAAGLAEYEWADPARFAQYTGKGDAAIWTGVSVLAAAVRYAETGTVADRDRLAEGTDAALRLFEVTGFPGYLARYHYVLVSGDATTPDRIVRDGSPDLHDHPVVEGVLPEDYATFVAIDGSAVTGQALWYGNPSIDQYAGMVSALPAAASLLDDPETTARVTTQITCALNRLERLEIIHLDQNELARDALATVFQGPLALEIEPGDFDPLAQDRLVLYVMRQYNGASGGPFVESCNAGPALEPAAVIDAADKSFVVDLFSLVADLDPTEARATSIDHLYVPNLRGADAIHLLHLAVASYHLTRDAQYLRFVRDVLLDDLEGLAVAQTLGALTPPTWCRSFYGDHVAALPLWSLLAMLEPGPVRDEVARALVEELWDRQVAGTANPKVSLFMVGEVDPEDVPDRAEAVAVALEALDGLGGNGGVLLDPRRTYNRTFDTINGALPAGIEPICPTEEERTACEMPLEIYGLTLGDTTITRSCRGIASECPMADGSCAEAVADTPLPVALRPYADHLWQRSPFTLGDLHEVDGEIQSPGLDQIELYWWARHYGWSDEGAGTVLAWIDDDAACAD